jgi:hypothetical protein
MATKRAYISLNFSVAVGLCVIGMLGADQASEKLARPIDKGQQVWTTGHSFHLFVPYILPSIAESAGIKGHVQVRGADGPLIAGKVDVVTCSPFCDPSKVDKGLEELTERALKHNPDPYHGPGELVGFR